MKKISEYSRDPVLFSREVLLFEPDDWQVEVLKDLATSNKVSVRSGQGVGKTGLEAVTLLWFLCCFPYARVVATAPTRQQLNDVLWAEISKWQSKSPLLKILLKWTKTRICMSGQEERWFAVARTATKPENMQGFHEDNMLFIVDEASGVADPIMEAIMGTLSGGNNKLLMCGNPTKTTGTFHDSFYADRSLYKCHKVSSLDSQRTNKDNIKSLIKKFGKDSNVVRVRIFGEFPLQDDDVFMPLSIVEQGRLNEVNQEPYAIDIGVDVARFGDDETVIAIKVGDVILPLICKKKQDTVTTAKEVVAKCIELRKVYKYMGNIYVKIDDTGVGGGVTDRIKEIKQLEYYEWLKVVAINFATKVNDYYYDDITTYIWAHTKDRLVEGTIRLPNDSDLIGQLSVRKKLFTERGKIKLESKKDMKARGLPSPDKADAVTLAIFTVAKGERNKPKRREGGARR